MMPQHRKGRYEGPRLESGLGSSGFVVVTREQRPHWAGGGDTGALRISPVHVNSGCQFVRNRNSAIATVIPIQLRILTENPLFEDLGVCQVCSDPDAVSRKKTAWQRERK